MAAGLPIIASDMNDNPEIIVHGKNGWIFPSGNQKLLEDRIRFCLINRDKLAVISDNNIKDAQQYEASGVLDAFARKLRQKGWPV